MARGGPMVTLVVNGKSHRLDVEPDTPLLYHAARQPRAARPEVRLRAPAVRLTADKVKAADKA